MCGQLDLTTCLTVDKIKVPLSIKTKENYEGIVQNYFMGGKVKRIYSK